MHAHLSGDVSQHLVAVLEFDSEHRVRQRLDDRAFEHDGVFLGLRQSSLLVREPGVRPAQRTCLIRFWFGRGADRRTDRLVMLSGRFRFPTDLT